AKPAFQDQARLSRRPQTLFANPRIQRVCQSKHPHTQPSEAGPSTLSSSFARTSFSGPLTWTVSPTRRSRTVPPLRPSISNRTRRAFPTRSAGCSIFSFPNSSPNPPMKSLDVLLYLLCMAGALAGYFLFVPPLSFVVIGLCIAFALWSVLAGDNSGKIVLRLGGLSWTMEDFVRGWLITGRTGSGKTQCAINAITFQVFRNVPYWGGVCLDQKGLYWEILVKMAAHFGREKDLT